MKAALSWYSPACVGPSPIAAARAVSDERAGRAAAPISAARHTISAVHCRHLSATALITSPRRSVSPGQLRVDRSRHLAGHVVQTIAEFRMAIVQQVLPEDAQLQPVDRFPR